MLVSEMHTQFKVAVDKTDSYNSANFLPEEIDLYLSDAQEEYIEQRAFGNNFKRESVEETQKRVSDLQSITYNTSISTFVSNSNNKPNGVFVALPDDYRHALNEEVQVTYSDCNTASQSTRVPVVALTHDQYNNAMASPFSKPSLKKIYRLPYGRFDDKEHFELVTKDNSTVSTYYLRYLKNPAKINLAQRVISPATTPYGLAATDPGELKDECYREIIQIAVKNALADIQSPGFQERIQRINEVE